jgi:hypothetical protein
MPQTFAKSLRDDNARDDDDTRELPLDWFDRQQEFQIKFDGVRPADPDRAAVHQQVFGPSSDPDKTAKHFLELLCKAQVADEPPPLKRKHEEVVMSPKKAKINSSEDSPAKKIKRWDLGSGEDSDYDSEYCCDGRLCTECWHSDPNNWGASSDEDDFVQTVSTSCERATAK